MKRLQWISFLENLRNPGDKPTFKYSGQDGMPIAGPKLGEAVWRAIYSIEATAQDTMCFVLDQSTIEAVDTKQRSPQDAFLLNLPTESIWLEGWNSFPEVVYTMDDHAEGFLARTEEDKKSVPWNFVHRFVPHSIFITENEAGGYFYAMNATAEMWREKHGSRLNDSPTDEKNPLYETTLLGVIDETNFNKQGLPRLAHSIARQLCDGLRDRFSAGTEKTNERVRIGSGETRKLIKIKNIVHVTPRTRRANFQSPSGREIDWTHRWEVMGHWRKLDGIGKDRYGDYSVKGATWITPHVKGPEAKPLVRKFRFVKGGLGSSASQLPNPSQDSLVQ